MDLSPLSSKVHNYQDSLDRTIPSILPSIHKNNRIVIDDRLTIGTRSLVRGMTRSRRMISVLEGGCSSLRPVHRRIINLPVPTAWLVASIVENYSCATGPLIPSTSTGERQRRVSPAVVNHPLKPEAWITGRNRVCRGAQFASFPICLLTPFSRR